jgi:hypothetical protein
MGKETEAGADQRPPHISRSRVEQDFLAGLEAIGSPKFFELMKTHFHPDGVLIRNCPSELLQMGGTHRGLPNVLEALRSFFVEFGVKATSVDDIVIDGAHIVVNYHMSMRHVGTGKTGRVSGLNHYVLDRDRKIASCNIFLDNASRAAIGDMLETFTSTMRGLESMGRRAAEDGDD